MCFMEFSTLVFKSCCGSVAKLITSIQHSEPSPNKKYQIDSKSYIVLSHSSLILNWTSICCLQYLVPAERRPRRRSWNCCLAHETASVFLTCTLLSWTSGWFWVVSLLIAAPAFAVPHIPCFTRAATRFIFLCLFQSSCTGWVTELFSRRHLLLPALNRNNLWGCEVQRTGSYSYLWFTSFKEKELRLHSSASMWQ